MESKACALCKKEQPLEEFWRCRTGRDGRQARCRACLLAAQSVRRKLPHAREVRKLNYQKNRQKFIERSRRTGLRVRYGITHEEYEKMVEAQDGRCAICGITRAKNTSGKRLAVDHDHDTGAIRGLLCAKCNFTAGSPPDILRRTADYVEQGGVAV